MTGWFDPGYLGLFAAGFLAATILPFSSEALFCYMLLGGYDVTVCLVVASTGNTAGGLTCYWLGHIAKWEWLKKYFRIEQAKVGRFEKRIRKYGPLAALFCWLPFAGDLLAVGLGFIRSNFLPVTLFMFLGKLGRYAALAYAMSFHS